MQKPVRVKLARQLRRNQSEAEEKLWMSLWKINLMGEKFRRQQPIGKYDWIIFHPHLTSPLKGEEWFFDFLSPTWERA
ncbi:MAG: DUF559 domain-containing protein [Dehalococcoidales bacterium]|nr:DUF559 domain-containing protein [Dehalococcoidales bacterium]